MSDQLDGSLGQVGITRDVIRAALAGHQMSWAESGRAPMLSPEQVAWSFMDGADWMAALFMMSGYQLGIEKTYTVSVFTQHNPATKVELDLTPGELAGVQKLVDMLQAHSWGPENPTMRVELAVDEGGSE